MWSRPALRPLQNGLRRYATQPESTKSFPAGPIYAVLGVAAAGGAYYLWERSGGATQAASAVKRKVVPSGNAAFKGGDQGFIDLKLESVDEVNHNTKRFRFALPEPGDVSGLHTASCLVTKYQAPGAEKPVIRPYTPVSDDNAVGFLDLIVKKYEGGPMSSHLHAMAPDQRLAFKGPISKYPLAENQHAHIGLIAGGTGITPMWQLIHNIFQNPNERTRVTLVFANVKEEDILMKKELEELENKYPQRFRAFYALDNPPPSWGGVAGRVTSELIKTVMPEPKEENIKMFVCGPPGMYKAISGPKEGAKQGQLSGVLKELGYKEDQVFKF